MAAQMTTVGACSGDPCRRTCTELPAAVTTRFTAGITRPGSSGGPARGPTAGPRTPAPGSAERGPRPAGRTPSSVGHGEAAAAEPLQEGGAAEDSGQDTAPRRHGEPDAAPHAAAAERHRLCGKHGSR